RRRGLAVLEPLLVQLERRRQREDRLAVLDREDAAGGEGPAVTHALGLVDDRYAGVAGADEVGVQGVDGAVARHGADGGDEGLPRHLAAEHPGGPFRRADPAEPVDLQLL